MIFIIGDSILRRLDVYSSLGWPKFLFDKNNIKVNGSIHRTTSFLKDVIINDFNEYVIIGLGICDCFPRFKTDITKDDLKKNIENKNYKQNVTINEFEENLLYFINKNNNSKVLLISIVCPSLKILQVKEINYSNIVLEEVNKYNDILKKLSNQFENVTYIDINTIFQKSEKLKDDLLLDMSGHVIPEKITEYSDILRNVIYKECPNIIKPVSDVFCDYNINYLGNIKFQTFYDDNMKLCKLLFDKDIMSSSGLSFIFNDKCFDEFQSNKLKCKFQFKAKVNKIHDEFRLRIYTGIKYIEIDECITESFKEIVLEEDFNFVTSSTFRIAFKNIVEGLELTILNPIITIV